MGYFTGMLKYIIKNSYKNTYPMVVFGGSVLALLYFFEELAKGQPTQGVIDYALTKYLPPLTVGGFVTVLIVGCVWAGVKWNLKTPRR